MNPTELKRLTAHYDCYFEQRCELVLHPVTDLQPHIDVLVYRPGERYPFWLLATAGASDLKMKAPKHALADRNEYILCINPDEDLDDRETIAWYHQKLVSIAMTSQNGDFVTIGHGIDWPLAEGEEMTAAFVDMPQMLDDPRVLRCKLGLMKQTACLLAILLTKNEMSHLQEVGPEVFSHELFPEDGSAIHCYSERRRTAAF